MKNTMALSNSAVRLLSIIAVFFMIAVSGAAFAASTIGGGIWTGARLPNGSPKMVGNAPIINDGVRQVKVMVQDLDTGDFVAYGMVAPGANTWSATVPGPGNYLAMFMADGHDVTSREYHVPSDGVAVAQEAYLPPAPLPKANLLLYAFKDHYVNSEDDYPMDYALKGVKFIVKNEKGVVVAEGISGSQTMADMPAGAGPDINGLYYFRNLEPGNYEVTVDTMGPIQISDPTTGTLVNAPGGTQWYQISSTEGTNVEEVTLYPGDPGTTAGGYWTWFAFVDKQQPLPAGADAGSISGRLFDADGPWFPLIEPFNPPPPQDQFVTPNLYVPKGLLVLYPNIQTVGVVKPIATTEADPVTGEYTFSNVPPGNYRIYAIDLPLDYIWQETQATVTPGAAVTGADIYLPRWFARLSGAVYDVATGLTVPGAKVTLRIEDGSVWKETVTDANGNYSFDRLPEVEVLGVVSVEPPPGYRAFMMWPVNQSYDMSSSTVQWYTANYRADLLLQPILPTEGVIRGFVHNDNLELKPDASGKMVWRADGLYDENEEKTFSGVTVELLDAAGTVVASTVTGGIDKADLIAQGWLQPYTWPVDEFGGVFMGKTTGQYEFRGLAPGSYQVRAVLPAGFSAVEPGGVKPVALAGGSSARADLGIKTEAPLAGEIEGGIFDDLNLDPNPLSIWFDEKAVIEGAPLGVYDHLGYFLGSAKMGGPLCYAGSTICPCGTPGVTPGCPVQTPEVGIRVAPGTHIFVGNDPAFPNNGYRPEFDPLPWTYSFGQGKNKFEADWSLIPTAMAMLDGGAMPGGPLGNDLITPQNQPVIVSITPLSPPPAAPVVQGGYFNMLALNNTATMTDAGSIQLALAATTTATAPAGVVMRIDGMNFGDKQRYSTVTLSGVKLVVKSWSNTAIVVTIPADSIMGALVVSTSTGISNAMYPDLVYSAKMTQNMSVRSVFVDAAATGGGNGSQGSPYRTINEALAKLPVVTGPKYVFVRPGTYNERIQIRKNDVNLIGYGAHETIINGSGPLTISPKGVSRGGPVVFIGRGGKLGAVSRVTVSGFTIEGGSTKGKSGGGIFGDYGNANLDINTSIITRNSGEYGGGIWLHKSNHAVRIWSNVIAANGAVGGYGGGISVNDEPVYGPAIPYGANEHVMDDANPPLKTAYNIYNNLVIYNVSPDYGGGMSLYEAKDMLNVIGNVIMENKSYDHGGGIFFEDCGAVDLSGNLFMHNYAADDGGAVSFEDVGDNTSTVKVYNNLFAENIADDMGENTARGGALAFDDTLRAEVYSNTIVGNVAAGTNKPRGGAIDAERHGHEYMNLNPAFSDVKVYNNIIWNNWRLDYSLDHRRNKEFAGQNYLMGVNYVWTQDNLHVDNPAVQGEWASQNNSESFTKVEYNNLSDGSYAARTGNMNADPAFANPMVYNWHLTRGSPASNKVPLVSAPFRDLEYSRRIVADGFAEMGAYEVLVPQPNILMIPAIRNIITMPKH
ncbi:IPT/TIG domain-containing protein [Candidatus Ferrigenium straubiae]|jgi:hypothetical protein|uniref:IPT/TIG domain-containing protein n=1 Tax=Candidatus Ferrigenium straubiae TaxID=2919506 RepID=UPI003F4A86BE